MLCYIFVIYGYRLCVIYVFCRLVVLVKLSVPVQAIDWKDLSLK